MICTDCQDFHGEILCFSWCWRQPSLAISFGCGTGIQALVDFGDRGVQEHYLMGKDAVENALDLVVLVGYRA